MVEHSIHNAAVVGPIPTPGTVLLCMFVKIGGVSGSGKSSTIPLVADYLQRKGYKTEIVKGSALMAAYLGVEEYELQFCSEEERVRARQNVYTDLYKKDREDPKIRLRDGHFAFVKVNGTESVSVSKAHILPGDLSQLKAIFVLDAPADIVSRRRREDKTRSDRTIVDAFDIDVEEFYEREEGRLQALQLGIPFFLVDTSSDRSLRVATVIGSAIEKQVLWKEREIHRYLRESANLGVEKR